MHPNALRVMREEHGLDLAGRASKHFSVFDGQRFDWVISLCDRVREVCPELPGEPATLHWSLPNPATGDADDVTHPLFQRTAAELETRIAFLLAAIADRTRARNHKERS
jgi:protein-tyrosine-phosphatase